MSTLNSLITQIQTDLSLATSRSVHTSMTSIINGRPLDSSLITNVANTVVNRTMGGIVNSAIQKVNSTISRALGSKFKNSPLNVIAGNYAASVMANVIMGIHGPAMSTHLSTSLSQGISRELYMQLPKSLTKNLNVDILGTTFNMGLSSIAATAINSTVRAIVNNNLGIKSPAATFNLNSVGSIPDTIKPTFSLDFNSITGSLGGLSSGVAGLVDSIGSGVTKVIGSLAGVDISKITDIRLPAGVDIDRLSGGPGLGKMIELSSMPMGTLSKIAGMSKEDFSSIQSQLAQSNINNPLASLGGNFQNLSETVMGSSTLSGIRSITKDMTSKFSDINSLFGVKSPADLQVLDQLKSATLEQNKTAATQAISAATNFQTNALDQLEKIATLTTGFKDPNAKFPLPDYANRTETNKLATGDVMGTIVDQKNASRMVGALLPNGGSWDQPVSPYAAKYPFNHVQETEAGHVIELDNTPNAERIHVFHKSGTFMEVDALGNRVQVIKGSDYTIVDRNGYISINGKANVSITGACNVHIGSDANIEVAGNTYLNSHNNIELNAAGRLKLTAGEGIDIKSPEVYVDADNQFQLNADVNAKFHVKELNMIVDTDAKIEVHNDIRVSVTGNSDTLVGGDKKTSVTGDIHNSGKAVFNASTGNFNVSAGADIRSSASNNVCTIAGKDIEDQCKDWVMVTDTCNMGSSGGGLSFSSTGTVSMDAGSIYLNSGMSTPSDKRPSAADSASQAVPAGALETEYSDAAYMVGRKSSNEIELPDSFMKPQTTSKVASTVLDSIMEGKTSLDDTQKATMTLEHNISPDDIGKAPIVLESLAATALPMIETVLPNELPLGDAQFPANWKLSPYFTLESLTTGTANPNPLESVGETIMPLSKVVANLQYAALNILEPIYAARPDMVVDSGFVPLSDTQQKIHRNNFGLSLSLDFKDATSFDDYFEIAKIVKDIVIFDEIILSYMSKEFAGSHANHASLIINIPGVFYPNVSSITDATELQAWVDANKKGTLKTWFNGTQVSDSSLIRLA